MKKINQIFFIPLLLSTIHLMGQTNTTDELPGSSLINTDRPTQAYSPVIIPLHSFQLETGLVIENETNPTDEISRYDIASTLLRYAIFDNFEIRATTLYRIKKIDPINESADSTVSGMGPLRFGFKVHVATEKGLRPELAIVSNITLRHVGEDAFLPTYSYPTASLVASNTLSPKFSLVYNAGFAYSGRNADGFFIYRVALNYNPVNKLVLFFEPYGNFDHGDLPNHKFNGGIMYLLADNFQIDVSAGTGSSGEITKSFVSMGFSWRLRK